MKQQTFHQLMKLTEKEFGGSLQKGHAREQRPVSAKKAMHLVLRSTLATKEKSFLNKDLSNKIKNIIYTQANEKGVKSYQYANNGNHLHLLILASSRKAFNQFIRAITGLIARLTLNINKNTPQKIKFFDAIPDSSENNRMGQRVYQCLQLRRTKYFRSFRIYRI